MTNAIQFRDEVEESLTTGELPEQGGGAIVPTVLPGIHTLRLPANLDQLWDAKDLEKRLREAGWEPATTWRTGRS